MMRFEYDDGGRAAAGFKGDARDCAARAIAIATGQDYRSVYDEINRIGKKHGSRARTGVFRETVDEYLRDLGWTWTPTMKVGAGCTVHLRSDELPTGNLVVRCSRHFAAVIDGVLRDTFDSSRGGRRCVYGFWSKR